jgi:hypothetical protein
VVLRIVIWERDLDDREWITTATIHHFLDDGEAKIDAEIERVA